MSCQHVGPLLSAWLEGELDAPEQEAVSAHVQACPRCGVELASLRRVVALLPSLLSPEDEELAGEAGDPALPPGFHDRFARRLADTPTPRQGLWRQSWAATVAACFAVLVAGAALWLPGRLGGGLELAARGHGVSAMSAAPEAGAAQQARRPGGAAVSPADSMMTTMAAPAPGRGQATGAPGEPVEVSPFAGDLRRDAVRDAARAAQAPRRLQVAVASRDQARRAITGAAPGWKARVLLDTPAEMHLELPASNLPALQERLEGLGEVHDLSPPEGEAAAPGDRGPGGAASVQETPGPGPAGGETTGGETAPGDAESGMAAAEVVVILEWADAR